MKKLFISLVVLFTLQFIASCASHHHDRFPSSEDIENEDYRRRHSGGRVGR